MLIGVNELVLVIMSFVLVGTGPLEAVLLLSCVLTLVICATFFIFCYNIIRLSDEFWCMFYPAFWNKNFKYVHQTLAEFDFFTVSCS